MLGQVGMGSEDKDLAGAQRPVQHRKPCSLLKISSQEARYRLTLVIIERLRQEDPCEFQRQPRSQIEFQAGQSYLARPYLKRVNIKRKTKNLSSNLPSNSPPPKSTVL